MIKFIIIILIISIFHLFIIFVLIKKMKKYTTIWMNLLYIDMKELSKLKYLYVIIYPLYCSFIKFSKSFSKFL